MNNKFTRANLERIPCCARIALMARLLFWVRHDLLENNPELELKWKKLFEKMQLTLDGLASGSIQANLTLANEIWSIAFDISVGAKVAAINGDDEYHRDFEAIHACATFLYNTILALQTHGVPKTLYLARGVDTAFKASNWIIETNSQASRTTNQHITEDYDRISAFVDDHLTTEEMTIPLDILYGSAPILEKPHTAPTRKVRFSMASLQSVQS